MIDIDIDTLTIDELERLRDACNQRILESRRTHGLALPDLLRLLEEVKTVLRDQGKEWFSLERWQWMDGQIRFWLNPKDQDLYQTGWFSVDDLIAWSRDSGFVMIEAIYEDDLDDEPWSRGVDIGWRTEDTPRNLYTSEFSSTRTN